MSLCGHNPPLRWCRQCKRAGLVPWEPGDSPPADWTPPPDSPAARGEFPAAVAATPAPARCAHLGAEPVGLIDCPTCTGRVRLKAFPCALGLGEAGLAVPSRHCGLHCPGYTPAAGATSSA
jgi:hypothetical protein